MSAATKTTGTCPRCGEDLAAHPEPTDRAQLLTIPDWTVRRGIIAKTRMGKGSLVKDMVRGMRKAKCAHVIFDVHDEHSPYGIDRGEECQLGDAKDQMAVTAFLQALKKDPSFFLKPDLSLALVPDHLSDDEDFLAEQLGLVAPHIRARRKVRLVLDETGFFAAKAEKLLYAMMAGWAKDEVGIDWIGQVWTMFPPRPRSQTDTLIAGRQWKRTDLQNIAGETTRAHACALTGLPKHQFIQADLGEAAASF